MPTSEHKIVKWLELGPGASQNLSLLVNPKYPPIDFQPRHLLGIRGSKAVETAHVIWDIIKDAIKSGNDPDLPIGNTYFKNGEDEMLLHHTIIAASPLSHDLKRKDLGQGAEVLVFCKPPGVSGSAYKAALDIVIAKANRVLQGKDIEQVPLSSGEKAFDITSIPGIDDLNLG